MTFSLSRWKQLQHETDVVWVNSVWGFRFCRNLPKWKRIIRLQEV